MSFPTDEIVLGPQSFGLRGSKGECYGIIWHTTEAAGTSREDALATVRYQLTHPGSYNFIIYDGGILLTVPYLEASGGTNPASASWAPERYPFLKNQLPREAYLNPNEYQLNVAFSVRTAAFRAGNIPDNMIDTAARLALWVEKQEWSSDLLVHSGHMHWQTNRSDPSEYVLKRIQDRVIELKMANKNPFSDIEDSEFKQQILRTAEFGLWATVDGKQIKFNPKGTFTREQAAAVFDRMLDKLGEYNK
jgi:hypothetical protein